MKPPFARTVIAASLMIWATYAATQQLSQSAQALQTTQETAMLPNLATINKTDVEKASATAKVELKTLRKPSFYHKAKSGTEVTEYRERGKVTQIKVRSNFGTHYQLSAPSDPSPAVQNNGISRQRVPAVSLSY